jgi:hypothetical protein
MLDRLWDRLEFLGELRKHRVARWVFLFWALVATYDTAGSQFLPPEWAQQRPTVYQVVSMTTGFLSWEAWLLVGALALAIFALEYPVRQKRRLALVQGREEPGVLFRQKMSFPFIGMIVCGLGFLSFAAWYWLDRPTKPPVQVSSTPLAPRTPAPSTTAIPQVSTAIPTVAPVQQAVDSPINWQFLDTKSLVTDLIFGTATGTSGYWIVRYRFSGVNKTREQLTNINAYILPKNSGEKIALQFEINPNDYIDTQATRGIPPGANFVLASKPFPNPPGRDSALALTVDEYLERYGGFQFVFEYAGGRFTHDFPYSLVRDLLIASKRQYDRENTPKPRILPKN